MLLRLSKKTHQRKVFCENMEACHSKFRSFDIKAISVVFSKLEEIMMADADTGFFVSPAILWESEKYKATGTLLMNDRIAHEIYFMAERAVGSGNIFCQHRYMSSFYPAPFRSISTLERDKATLPNPAPAKLKFEPSDHLLNNHSWNLRTGHQDSPIMFWNKKKKQRATPILGSFKSLSDIGPPPSYGDKELPQSWWRLSILSRISCRYGLSRIRREELDTLRRCGSGFPHQTSERERCAVVLPEQRLSLAFQAGTSTGVLHEGSNG